ncbi:MAG: isoprenyl transferase [Alphaproteobacteria bacterium]|jgi:undecaprenyl diphosphate synthase|nr:isoprenyl transferase [Alphaproteobacteria bacterium]MDP6814239.1 isoprenyl transferase [Alphaproteobacteria bacterium]
MVNNLSPKTASPPPPRHIAIIMDGNGRWAKARGLPRVAGHQRGADAVRGVVEACQDLGISYLTLYAFSSENWKRPPAEVDDLMGLLRVYLRRELRELHRSGVRVRFIGNWSVLAKDIVDLIEDAERTTRHNTGLTLIIAVNYGSHNEILGAVRRIAEQVGTGRLKVEDIDDAVFAHHLNTDGIPDPDLIVRTSGEKRLSNFLLWQAAYAELLFTDLLWPDFNRQSLEEVVDEFHRRDRRYGATSG